MATIWLVLLMLAVGFIDNVSSLSRPSTIVFENNQYKNVVIAIHESVPEDKALIDKLKTTMTAASKYLYKATRHRAYLKEIKILLPSTWSADPSYGVPTTETLTLADVIITNTTKSKRSVPQTRSYEGCGKQGVHVLLTPEFLTLPRVPPYYNDAAKYFVHAFAQFRWGVFQEYSEEGENVFYFSLTTGHPEAIRCVLYIRGLVQKNDANHTICYKSIDPETGIYTPDCLWRPYPTRQRVQASIMDHQYIQAITTFCDDNTTNYQGAHNFEAPSKHNRLCSHRSTWDVIINTDDFSGGKNQPINKLDYELEPSFTVLRATSRNRRAVVLVKRDEIKKKNKRAELNMTIDRLNHELKDIDVHISTEEIPDDILAEAITETGHPFPTKLQDLVNINDDFETHAILLTDNITDTDLRKNKMNNEISNGLKMTFVKLNDDRRTHLQVKEGMHDVFHEGRTSGHQAIDRIRDIITRYPSTDGRYAIIHRADFVLKDKEIHRDVFHTDGTLNSKLMFTVHYESSIPDILLLTPSGVRMTTESPDVEVNQKSKFVVFSIKHIEIGAWNYTVKLATRSHAQPISVIVTSVQSDEVDHLNIKTSVKRYQSDNSYSYLILHCDVTHDSQPVIGLNVTAKIELPNGNLENIDLHDNGASADLVKNDGIYSRFFTKLHNNGHYHVVFLVHGAKGKTFRKEEEFISQQWSDEQLPIRKMIYNRSMEGQIQRHVTGESIYHDNPAISDATDTKADTSIDIVPPSRVSDLKVERYIPYRHTVVLSWTAPGDDMDAGRVSAYRLYIGHGIRDIRDLLKFSKSSEHKVVNGEGHITMEMHNSTVKAMEHELLMWNIQSPARMFAFAIVGIDENDNAADMSNVVTMGILN